MYWPYDEVSLHSEGERLTIDSPWLKISVEIDESERHRAQALAEKFAQQSVGPQDLGEIQWFFGPLSAYPLCYLLPRPNWEGPREPFELKDSSLLPLEPAPFLKQALALVADSSAVTQVSEDSLFQGEWKWDAEGAFQFAHNAEGIDPVALFSVARRFHLLNSLENDTTRALYDQVKALDPKSEAYRRVSSLMVRQNHYVTQQCDSALRPALDQAQSARPQVAEFMRAELGHDRLLGSALQAMDCPPESVPVTRHSKVLMELLRYAAGRNFLAFAMIVDFFERSAYEESDPLAQILEHGGQNAAARQINRHMEINDSGGHENVALGFLAPMGPVSPEYALEALRLAEATTNVMNLVSTGVRELWEGA